MLWGILCILCAGSRIFCLPAGILYPVFLIRILSGSSFFPHGRCPVSILPVHGTGMLFIPGAAHLRAPGITLLCVPVTGC